ncbi:MAG: IS21-like element helper ATPase IstB [Deltaproteobacteria bacterium]|jgi:DNA replication protein DnaC|nr:IS21-like element helper ATPase IstB [Deltaproteobacteria bacterium]MBW2238965.1 IS21-like element helper ATPase IstB [Deltaproteobacteria bacterium]MBW2572235.1 IS21-like element helper ATPase IstB [Deltaproteobacteria bacterium]
MREKLHQLLIELSLKGMANVLDKELNRAEKKGSAFDSILSRLLAQELAYRQERSMLYRLNHAKIPWDWTLKTFPFDKQPGVRKPQIMSLAGLSFIERAENIVFIGNPGTGKSGLASGLLHQALIDGYRGRFYNAQDLLDELYASLADRTTPKLIKRLCNYPILVIDELGYLTLKPEQVNAFFKLMGERYGKSSTIITTNLEYEEWYDLFRKKPLVDALLDRLKHRCITIKINGPSLRIPSNEQKSNKPT